MYVVLALTLHGILLKGSHNDQYVSKLGYHAVDATPLLVGVIVNVA